MEFGSFKERIAKATAKATSVAKTFQNLDQMAQEDNYIQSDGLNVKTRDDRLHERDERRRQKQQKERQQEEMRKEQQREKERKRQELQLRMNMAKAVQAKAQVVRHEERNNTTEHLEMSCSIEQEREALSSQQQQQQNQQHDFNSYLHQSVAELMDPPERKQQQQQQQQFERHNCPQRQEVNDDDDHDDDDDVENDPIMKMVKLKKQEGQGRKSIDIIRKQSASPINMNALKVKENNSINIPIGADQDLDESVVAIRKKKNSDSKKKKDPNRFFADLDARLSKEEDDGHEQNDKSDEYYTLEDVDLTPTFNKSRGSSPTRTQQSSLFQENNMLKSFQKLENKMDWLQTTLSPKLQSFAKIIANNEMTNTSDNDDEMNPLASSVDEETGIQLKNESSEDETIRKITSSSLALGQEEAAELERLQQQMKGGGGGSSLDIYLFIDSMLKRKYFTFLFLPLLLVTFVYFMIRKKVNELR